MNISLKTGDSDANGIIIHTRPGTDWFSHEYWLHSCVNRPNWMPV